MNSFFSFFVAFTIIYKQSLRVLRIFITFILYIKGFNFHLSSVGRASTGDTLALQMNNKKDTVIRANAINAVVDVVFILVRSQEGMSLFGFLDGGAIDGVKS
jgi:hypothetical protein